MKPSLFVTLLAIVLGHASALVCPRTNYTGNYLNYIQLAFQNDDNILSFANTKTEIAKMWERVGHFSNTTATTLKDRMEAFLVLDKSLPKTRAYLYMVWVMMNGDDTLNKIVAFSKFEVDYTSLTIDLTASPSPTTPNMISALFRLFFNQDTEHFTVAQNSKFNSVQTLCFNQYAWGVFVATTANVQSKYDLYDWADAGDAAPSGPNVHFHYGTCICASTVATAAPVCTTFSLLKRFTTPTSMDIPQSNPLNPARSTIYNRIGIFAASPATTVTDGMGSAKSLVFDFTDADKTNDFTTNCNPNIMKLEYDHYFYMFANYYKNGIGQTVPKMLAYE